MLCIRPANDMFSQSKDTVEIPKVAEEDKGEEEGAWWWRSKQLPMLAATYTLDLEGKSIRV